MRGLVCGYGTRRDVTKLMCLAELLLPRGNDAMIYEGNEGVRFRFRAPWKQLGYVVVEAGSGEINVIFSISNDRKCHMIEDEDDDDEDNQDEDEDEGEDQDEDGQGNEYDDEDEYSHYDEDYAEDDDEDEEEDDDVDDDEDEDDDDDDDEGFETVDDEGENIDSSFEDPVEIMPECAAAIIGAIANSGQRGVTFDELMAVSFPDHDEDGEDDDQWVCLL